MRALADFASSNVYRRVQPDKTSAYGSPRAIPVVYASVRWRERIYHLLFDRAYDATVIEPERGEFYAANVEQSENAGFRRPPLGRQGNRLSATANVTQRLFQRIEGTMAVGAGESSRPMI